MMIKRDLYLNQLYDYIDKPFIKVITGIRRSGKSAILMLLRNELLRKGIEGKNIIYINFESFEYSDIDKADKLYMFIKAKITNKQRYYILLDEIQEVVSWEKAVNSALLRVGGRATRISLPALWPKSQKLPIKRVWPNTSL